MIRLLQLALVLMVGVPTAGCTAWAVTQQRLRYRHFVQDWGLEKPHKTFLLMP